MRMSLRWPMLSVSYTKPRIEVGVIDGPSVVVFDTRMTHTFSDDLGGLPASDTRILTHITNCQRKVTTKRTISNTLYIQDTMMSCEYCKCGIYCLKYYGFKRGQKMPVVTIADWNV